MTHRLTVRSIAPVTHDTYRLILPKPDGYAWKPGQATEIALDQEGWRDEKRPFTFVNDPKADTIELVIKSYPDHDGVTKRIAELQEGDALLLEEPWGAIHDEGPGVFLAGGAGITPMLGLLRARGRGEGVGRPGLEGCTLIFANKTRADIILREELEAMEGLKTVFPLSEEEADGHPHGHIDGALLDAHVSDWSQIFYVCGPPPMEEALGELLRERDVPDARIIHEE